MSRSSQPMADGEADEEEEEEERDERRVAEVIAVLCGIQVLGGRRKKPYEQTMEDRVQSDGSGRVNRTGQEEREVTVEGRVTVSGAENAGALTTADVVVDCCC